MSKIEAVVIPVSLKDKPYVVSIEDKYQSYLPLIGCRCFDVVELYSDDKVSVDCYVDDEGLINGSPVSVYWFRAYKEGLIHSPLFGVSVITMTNMETGETTETDLSLIKKTLASFGFTQEELLAL